MNTFAYLYNTLVLKVRGDGRSYLINLTAEGYYDILWNDIYHYVLYTRGGPHWQIAKIPFSKFFLASKGRVQDQQGPVPLNRITNVGFSVGSRGGHEGSFRLEFDFIGLEFDPSHQEEFAYEMYRQPKYIVRMVHVVEDRCTERGGDSDQLYGSIELADKRGRQLGGSVRHVKVPGKGALKGE
uniref:NADH:ubiquinone oxidoreductase intermediate-associated protein 30 domain-containing protein n=1 Tax=Anopheles stephensi TaxID=30069 RepID=A0A182XYD1_ANOST